MFIDKMKGAYLEAAYWTDAEQCEHDDPDFTDLFVCHAWQSCRNFCYALESMEIDYTQFDPDQLGHDLWLTRNGHGAGFWDRSDDVYPKVLRKVFTALAKAQGEHHAEFKHQEII
jgi:hypothetical protein